MSQQQQVTLPPIKHVFKGLLNAKPTDTLHRKFACHLTHCALYFTHCSFFMQKKTIIVALLRVWNLQWKLPDPCSSYHRHQLAYLAIIVHLLLLLFLRLTLAVHLLTNNHSTRGSRRHHLGAIDELYQLLSKLPFIEFNTIMYHMRLPFLLPLPLPLPLPLVLFLLIHIIRNHNRICKNTNIAISHLIISINNTNIINIISSLSSNRYTIFLAVQELILHPAIHPLCCFNLTTICMLINKYQ
ncbi:hypothetical protein BD408DRAFT_35319 [Parasitella parasitica]|nr:hypothetical protein BD408DRAFT_35319 [Parasitella parasitica]